MFDTDCVAVFSGGLDSTTLVYKLLHDNHRPHLLTFNYGQRHKREIEFACATAQYLNLPHDIIDLTGLKHLISNSALTSPKDLYTPGVEAAEYQIDVPEGYYAEENMKQTIVPNRNMIMLSIAAGVAVNERAQFIGVGVHAGDHFVYPDCRPEFINSVEAAIYKANEGLTDWEDPTVVYEPGDKSIVYTPFLNMTKADIAYEAVNLGVQLAGTWSCYKGGVHHCGRCGTCVERLEAIDAAKERYFANGGTHFIDVTQYEDSDYWKSTVKK